MRHCRIVLTASLFALAAAHSSALAQDVPPVVEAMLKSWEAQYKIKPTYKSIEAGGDGIIIEGLEATLKPEGGAGPSMTISVEEIALEEVSDEGAGLFEVGSATYSNMKLEVSGQKFSIAVPELKAEDWYIKTIGENPTPADVVRASMNVARKMDTGAITVAVEGQTITADGYHATWDGDPATGAGKVDGKLENVVIPESLMALADQGGMLKNLGYSTLSFDIGGGGTISNDGEKLGMDIDGYYAVKNVGTLKVGIAVAGISHALIDAMSKSDEKTDPSTFLPLAQGTNFGRLVVRFEDQGVTGKVLPMVAAMQGQDAATFAANAGAIIQLGMAELKMPDLTKQVVDAVNAYLADPRSITVALKPAQPVSVAQLMTINPADPAAAVAMFGLSVTAND